MPDRVLLMTYEFPPAGGGGVQRVAKFARYLPEAGWEPLVVCGEPVRGRPMDASLFEEVSAVEVVRTPSRNPSVAIAQGLALLKRAGVRGGVSGGGAGSAPASGAAASGASAASGSLATPGAPTAAPAVKRPPLSARLARKISADDAALWAGPAVRAAIREGRRAGVRAVVASGPPFTVLEAGARVASALGVPFIADMRDAWRDNPAAYYPTPSHRARALARQRAVMTSADVVLGVSEPIVTEAREMGGRDVRLLTNGFDSADLVQATGAPGPDLRLAFMGKVYRGHSDPWHLLEALAASATGDDAASVYFDLIGSADEHVASRVRELNLESRVTLHGYQPHKVATAMAAASDVGLVLIADVPGAKASLTGKLFEYLGMGLPVLVLGPLDGEAAKLVTSTGAGWAVAPDDVEAITSLLKRLAASKAAGEPVLPAASTDVSCYERRQLTAQLGAILAEVTGS